MTGNKAGPQSCKPDELRARAVQRVREKTPSATKRRGALSNEESLRLICELEVHQIELEMQNEELNRAQAELEASRARYFDLYDLAPVAYFTVSEPGLILEANLTAATLLGVARSALAGKPFSGFVFPEDQDIYHIQRTQFEGERTSHSWEMRMKRADGSSFWVQLQAAPGQNGERRITLNDISERKRAEATLAKADARLRQLQKTESLERMAGAIAHLFNNKLQAVMGNLELATRSPTLDAGSAGLLSEAMQAALQAAEISTTMLTFLGKRAGDRVPLDLSQACRWTLPLLQASLPTGVRLETDYSSPGPIVIAHADQIQQILLNLITNAGEAVGKGDGVVRLSVSTVAPAHIPEAHRLPIGWEPQNMTYACLNVTDTGRGIADHDVERLFDPFFSDKDTGRGLGLSVVLGILRNHGGAIAVSSEPGRGSTFRVFLPLSAEKAWPSSKKSAAFKPDGAVLLVDDEDRVRSVAAALLRSLGFTVLEAGDGSDAVEKLDRHRDRIGLVLCDLTMPGMDGWETLTALRKLVPGIPVILTSGHDKAQAMAGSHPELPQVFLRKPYLSRDLDEAIRLALGAKATP